ncbi:hypothetical protein R5R35_010249 [Gryllus longicercus]|uniref:Uncharacterized protein n=1 Tax=Gryllus longicercus TaxID=2509291 RepID=A0AAN9VMS9_9ORTH
MERRGLAPRPRAFDLGDPRTPMAWQHRNFNFQQEHQQLQQAQAQHYYVDRYMGGIGMSPTEMLHPSDSCDEPMMEELYHHHLQQQHQQQQQQQQHAAAMAAAAAAAGLPMGLLGGPHPHAHTHTLSGRGGGGGGGAMAASAVVAAGGMLRSPRSPRGPRSRSRSAGRSHPGGPHAHPAHRALSTSSNSSATSDSTALDSDSQLRADAGLPPTDLHQLPVRAPTLGTLRSVQSTLSTWDGEPCPVHHMQMPMGLLLPPPPAQLYPVMAVPLPAPPPPPPPPPLPPPPPPPVLLPPMLRPRPLVLAAEAAGRPEPLPVRDPKTSVSPLPPKDGAGPPQVHCCKGNIIVLWVVLGIICVGILLAVILRFVTV